MATMEAPSVSMVTQSLSEISGVRVDQEGNWNAQGTAAKFMYYTKGVETDEPGFVVIASAHPIEYRRFARRGMKPLDQFGDFSDVNPADRWNIYREPYKRILQRGGAALFPVAQILEKGWHKKPPYPGVTFPQLEGVVIEEHKCSYCPRVFLTQQSLQSHESIRHQTTSQQTQLARHLADANTGILKDVLEKQQLLENKLADALTMLAQNLAPRPTERATKTKAESE